MFRLDRVYCCFLDPDKVSDKPYTLSPDPIIGDLLSITFELTLYKWTHRISVLMEHHSRIGACKVCSDDVIPGDKDPPCGSVCITSPEQIPHDQVVDIFRREQHLDSAPDLCDVFSGSSLDLIANNSGHRERDLESFVCIRLEHVLSPLSQDLDVIDAVLQLFLRDRCAVSGILRIRYPDHIIV